MEMEEAVEGEEVLAIDCLLRIPEEVLYGYVFPYLKLNELLRLRRSCKQLRNFSSDFIRNHFINQEREINETDNTFRTFIDCDFPTSRIFINNTGHEIFEHPDLPEFINLYAARIAHLRIKTLKTCLTPEMNNFFLGLINLECLEIPIVDARDTKFHFKFENGTEVIREKSIFPETFRKLKTMKLGRILGSEIFGLEHCLDFVDFCPNLEYIQLMDGNLEGNSAYHHNEPCHRIIKYINTRLQDPDQPLKLKYYDLQGHWREGITDSAEFTALWKLFYTQHVKLFNFDATCLGDDYLNRVVANDFLIFPLSIVTVQNIEHGFALMQLPNLEKLTIKSTANCTHNSHFIGFPGWPKITCFDVTIDSRFTKSFGNNNGSPVTELLEGLFRYQNRETLKELRIGFDKGACTRFGYELPCPRAHDIVRKCKDVTKLTLMNWIGTNKAVSMFWSGLENLEEVVIDQCELMGDVAFVGKNREEPVLLKLKNLKKFTLNRLDTMPKITDLVFKLVFSHLRIMEFHVTSNEPIQSVTARGIQYLSTGEFNNNVEKFPFSGWSLENVSEEEFSQLKSEFRASYML